MWTRVAATVLGAIALASCGSGDGDSGGGGDDAPTAASFVDCFRAAGFEAVEPKPREESVLAFQARSKGYGVEPVNVQRKGMLTPSAFLVFFESAAKAKDAMKELNATSYGEVPPQQRGPAVIGYGDEEDRAAVEPAIAGCL